MKLVSLGNLEKGCPVFLNEEPYSMVGLIKLEKAGDSSIISITLDDKALKPGPKAPKATRGRKPKEAKADAAAAPKKRGRKPGPKAKAATKAKTPRKPRKAKEVAAAPEAAV